MSSMGRISKAATAAACAIAVAASDAPAFANYPENYSISESYTKSLQAFSAYLCAKEFYDPGNKDLAWEYRNLWMKALKLSEPEYTKAIKYEKFIDDARLWFGKNPSQYCNNEKKIKAWRLAQPLLKKPRKGQVSQGNAHEKCLDAKDYEGCIRVVESRRTNSASRNDCKPDGRCVIKFPGKDIFGLKQPVGWLYYETEEGDRVNYFSPTVYRVPHKNQGYRYLARPEIVRFYRNPEAGSSGSFIGGGSASTDCVDLGGSISCSTTSSPGTYIPGRSATPGGVRSMRFTRVVDCKDETYASYKRRDETRTSYGWLPASESSWSLEIIEEFCPKARTLPTLKMKL
ncbi:hypothetical protein [Synechococcus sp. W4D4]|uniref:hypothetical protein n=1 Tax=Synechococcus sp. W4D4 TaxID=3392294 RepID=UPI0039EBCA28